MSRPTDGVGAYEYEYEYTVQFIIISHVPQAILMKVERSTVIF